MLSLEDSELFYGAQRSTESGLVHLAPPIAPHYVHTLLPVTVEDIALLCTISIEH